VVVPVTNLPELGAYDTRAIADWTDINATDEGRMPKPQPG